MTENVEGSEVKLTRNREAIDSGNLLLNIPPTTPNHIVVALAAVES
jgi:hypothetical protein